MPRAGVETRARGWEGWRERGRKKEREIGTEGGNTFIYISRIPRSARCYEMRGAAAGRRGRGLIRDGRRMVATFVWTREGAVSTAKVRGRKGPGEKSGVRYVHAFMIRIRDFARV